MEKIAKRVLALLMAAALFIAPSCGESETTEPAPEVPAAIELTVTPDQVSFPPEGELVRVTVDTNAESWDFVNGLSWLDVAKSEGGLILVASSYRGSATRRGEILVVANQGTARVEKTIQVEQVALGDTSQEGNLSFECPVFKELMLEYYDADGDGEISEAEAAVVTEMVLTLNEEDERAAITSLNGIKKFVNLVNLDCDYNMLTDLDLSGMEKLEYVDCSYNEIKRVNLNGCKSLKWFYGYMNQMETLNIEGCDQVMFIQAWKNKLTSLDVSDKPELVYLDLRMNNLRDIEFYNCPKLNVAAIGGNNIMSLELSGLPELYTLGCYENNIATLDVSRLPKLEMLECYDNNIAVLDLSANTVLAALVCSNNMISSLTLNPESPLKKLDCGNNRLEGTLDVTGYDQLYYLHCGGNAFTEVNASTCVKMTNMACENTNVTTLDVTNLTLLESLVANNCQITTMDCSKNLNLSTLYLHGNPLQSLILSEGQSISDLKLDNHDVIVYQ